MEKEAKVTDLLDHIEKAISAIYIRGCDDIAMSNLAQLRGIHCAVEQIKAELSKKEGEIHEFHPD